MEQEIVACPNPLTHVTNDPEDVPTHSAMELAVGEFAGGRRCDAQTDRASSDVGTERVWFCRGRLEPARLPGKHRRWDHPGWVDLLLGGPRSAMGLVD